MDKVWLIERGEYSDYHVVGVFSSKENADIFLKMMAENDVQSWSAPSIREVDLDMHIKDINAGLKYFHISMNYDGSSNVAEHTCFSCSDPLKVWKRTLAPAWQGKPISDMVAGHVWARDEKHAVKIANEYRVQAIANNTLQVRD